MRFSVMTEPQMGGTYEQLLALARFAEDRGLASFARSDHYYSGADPARDATDAFATLAGLARDTQSIRLCVLVSPITFRHPAVIVKNAVTIDQMSGGRFDLGIGTGWMEEEHDAFGLRMLSMAERFERFGEALSYVRAAIGPQPADYRGKHYQLQADVRPGPTGSLPLIVGGTGKKRTPALAGTLADEYNQTPQPPEVLAANIATMREAARKAGRDPDTIVPSVMGSVLLASDDRTYRERLAVAAAARSMSTDELSERYAGAGIPTGTPDQARATIEQWQAAGVERFYLRHMELDDIDLLAENLDILGA